VNLGVTVFVQVTLNLQVEGRLDTFEEAIRQRPEVLDCYMMAGEADYLLRVTVPDVAAYERFLKESLTRIENVASFKSTFALKEAKYSTVLPVMPSTSEIKMKSSHTPVEAPARRKPWIARR
jgi:DNA-binding Lrp family transcriptional regulator